MCSFDGRSGNSTGAIPGARNEQAWKDHLEEWCSLGPLARLGVPVGGWVRKLRAVGITPSHPLRRSEDKGHIWDDEPRRTVGI